MASTIIKGPKQVLKSTVHLYLKPNVTFCNKNMEEKEKDLKLKNLFLVFIDVKWGQFLFEQLNVIQHLFLYSFYQIYEGSYDLTARNCVGVSRQGGCCSTNEWNIFSMIVFDYAVNCSKNH